MNERVNKMLETAKRIGTDFMFSMKEDCWIQISRMYYRGTERWYLYKMPLHDCEHLIASSADIEELVPYLMEV